MAVLTRMGVTVELLRSARSARDRHAVHATNTQGDLRRKPRLADLRDAGPAGHRSGRQARRASSVIVDNSWATPLFHKPLALGADIVVHAGTKMFVGHSDAMFGTVSANERAWPAAQADAPRSWASAPRPTIASSRPRGLRTLAIRMKEHSARSTGLAGWLEAAAGRQPASSTLPCPATPITRSSSAISPARAACSASSWSPKPRAALAAMVDGFELFGMGWSWGGYESLCLPIHPERSAPR